jgi:3-dehydrosphinganine reductase
VNLVGTLNALKLVIPDLKSQKEGRVCIVSSLAGQVSMWGMSTYSSTKFALKGLTEAIQMEFIDSNIAATIVYPPGM